MEKASIAAQVDFFFFVKCVILFDRGHVKGFKASVRDCEANIKGQ